MPRNMSVTLTMKQVQNRTKTVTRRTGWRFLKPGERLWLVEKAMGLKKGQKVNRLALVEVVSVRRERLNEITDGDVAREGFPRMSSVAFVAFFIAEMGGSPDQEVTRIAWRYLDEGNNDE